MKYEIWYTNGAGAEVEVDPEIFTEQWMESYRRYFHNVTEVEEHIVNLAWLTLNAPRLSFWEGYGPVRGWVEKTLTVLDEDGNDLGIATTKPLSGPDWEVESISGVE